MKACNKCGKLLELILFYRKPNSKDGLQNWCKECDNKRHKLWRKNHPEEVRQMSKLQRMRHPEEMREAVNKYAKQHRKERQERIKKWANKNRYKIQAHKKVYYAVKTGKLIKQNCFCGKIGQAHHDDYSKPLEVIWLCPIHHKARHMELNAKLLGVKL